MLAAGRGRAAAGRGVTASALSGYCLEERPPPGLVLGYAAFDAEEIRTSLRRLGEALATV